MPKKKVVINWSAVEDAMARSMRGHASQADNDLCQEAFNVDRKKYSELSNKVRIAAHRSMNPMLAGKGNDNET